MYINIITGKFYIRHLPVVVRLVLQGTMGLDEALGVVSEKEGDAVWTFPFGAAFSLCSTLLDSFSVDDTVDDGLKR